MRYRRIRYRYTRVVQEPQTDPLTITWSGLPPVPVSRPQWRPAADLFERPDAFVARIELAGVQEEDVDIALYADALVVEGQRHCPQCGEARFHSAEILYGPFRVELPMPPGVDPERAQAELDRGFLSITLPKAEAGGR